MKVVALKHFRHDRLGPVKVGRVVELAEPWLSTYLAQGVVERYETKVLREVPLPAAGEEQRSRALPADQASPSATLSESGSGGKRKRKKSAE